MDEMLKNFIGFIHEFSWHTAWVNHGFAAGSVCTIFMILS